MPGKVNTYFLTMYFMGFLKSIDNPNKAVYNTNILVIYVLTNKILLAVQFNQNFRGSLLWQKFYESITELIGGTPLLKAKNYMEKERSQGEYSGEIGIF